MSKFLYELLKIRILAATIFDIRDVREKDLFFKPFQNHFADIFVTKRNVTRISIPPKCKYLYRLLSLATSLRFIIVIPAVIRFWS